MRRFIFLVLLAVLAVPTSSWAQSQSVEFRAFVFDGALSGQEAKDLAETVAALPKERRAIEHVRLMLNALRSTRSQIASGAIHFSETADRVARQRIESDHILIEARVRRSDATMDYSVGAAYVDGKSNLTCHCILKRQGFEFGERLLTTASADSLHIVLTRFVADEKAFPAELPKDFGSEFRRDRSPTPKRGTVDIALR